MSTLTKILVILLAFFSFALCGAVVTFVVNTNNYKTDYVEQLDAYNAISASNKSLTTQINLKNDMLKEQQIKFNEELQAKDTEISVLSNDLQKAERLSTEYESRINSWSGIVDGFNDTISSLEKSLKLTQEQLDKARAQGLKDQQQLNEISAQLYEKIVQMQALEADRRRFLEQKQSLEDKLAKLLSPQELASIPETVTREPGPAQPAITAKPGGPLNGLITEVGQSLVTISLGSDDGVKDGMTFHITRGSEFICDVVITNVDVNKAAGVIELKQKEPRIGDNASTKL